MTDFDNAQFSGNGAGGEGARQEGRSQPYFPTPPPPPHGATVPQPGPVPLSAPASVPIPLPDNAGRQPQAQPPQPPQAEPQAQPQPSQAEAPRPAQPDVPGQIKIGDEVVRKIATLAANEVTGVAGLGEEGVRVRTAGDELTLDLNLVVRYGSVVMDVAVQTRNNVGRVAARMLGMRIAAVNITVGDVWLPDTP